MNEHIHDTGEPIPDHSSAQFAATELHEGQDGATHASAHTTHATNEHATIDHSEHPDHPPHADPGGHAGHSEAMFQRPFWISLLLTIPILFYAGVGIAYTHLAALGTPKPLRDEVRREHDSITLSTARWCNRDRLLLCGRRPFRE